MENFKALLTTTEGRIGRQQWWIGSVLVAIAALIANAILLSMFAERAPGFFVAGSLFVTLLVLWLAYCLGVKRRHDRGNAGNDLRLFLAGILISQLIQFPRMIAILSGGPIEAPALWMQVIGFGWSIFGLYILVQLGFLRGTAGPNSYGPELRGSAGGKAAPN